MRVLIVDDAAPARARLRRLLGAIDDVQVAGEAQDAREAAVPVGATLLVCFAGFEAVRRVGWLQPWMGLEPRPDAAPAPLVPGARQLP